MTLKMYTECTATHSKVPLDYKMGLTFLNNAVFQSLSLGKLSRSIKMIQVHLGKSLAPRERPGILPIMDGGNQGGTDEGSLEN